jgi:hypothetical protein
MSNELNVNIRSLTIENSQAPAEILIKKLWTTMYGRVDPLVQISP